MPDEKKENLDLIVEIKLKALREALKKSEESAETLRRENSILRITACGAGSLADQLKSKGFLKEFESLWVAVPIESTMEYIGALEKCLEVLSSIAALKRKTINIKKIADRDAALVQEAIELRNKPGKHVQAALNQELTKREKAIKQWAKTLNITYEKAEAMMDEAEKKVKK